MFKQTPNLSQEFHPVSKPNAKIKSPPKPIAPLGKKGKANKQANAAMKQYFEEIGITTCELQFPGCWYTTTLGFAHPKKRRFLNKEDLTQGILACTPCHGEIEYVPHATMQKIVEDIIQKRKIPSRVRIEK